MNAGVVGAGGAVQRLQTETGRRIGGQGQVNGPAHQQCAITDHEGSAVHQRQALFFLKHQRVQPGPAQRVRAG